MGVAGGDEAQAAAFRQRHRRMADEEPQMGAIQQASVPIVEIGAGQQPPDELPVADVRQRHDQPSAGAQQRRQAAHDRPRIGQVLQHVEAEDQVQRPCGDLGLGAHRLDIAAPDPVADPLRSRRGVRHQLDPAGPFHRPQRADEARGGALPAAKVEQPRDPLRQMRGDLGAGGGEVALGGGDGHRPAIARNGVPAQPDRLRPDPRGRAPTGRPATPSPLRPSRHSARPGPAARSGLPPALSARWPPT